MIRERHIRDMRNCLLLKKYKNIRLNYQYFHRIFGRVYGALLGKHLFNLIDLRSLVMCTSVERAQTYSFTFLSLFVG